MAKHFSPPERQQQCCSRNYLGAPWPPAKLGYPNWHPLLADIYRGYSYSLLCAAISTGQLNRCIKSLS